mmetsp:Transcript_136125/g.236585  ORF Transcript_136125/g.236585 Transcript_136125/m.236585 type:complete len:186 (+) Transcript_136125:60-617(+)
MGTTLARVCDALAIGKDGMLFLDGEDGLLIFEEEHAALTEKDIVLVEQTWLRIGNLDVEHLGVKLFKNIFQAAPQALQLFSFKDEAALYESPKLKRHATKVVMIVNTAVSKLRDLDALVPVLKALALKHIGYGVLPAHYDVVGEALIKTLADGLGKDFTIDVKRAWQAVWTFISQTMIGAAYIKK